MYLFIPRGGEPVLFAFWVLAGFTIYRLLSLTVGFFNHFGACRIDFGFATENGTATDAVATGNRTRTPFRREPAELTLWGTFAFTLSLRLRLIAAEGLVVDSALMENTIYIH